MRTLLVICVLAAGCGDDGPDTCGPGSAAAAGIDATGSGVELQYASLGAGLNGDCGVGSLTIFGSQSNGSNGVLTLCVPKPGDLATQSLALGPDAATSAVRLVDLGGTGSDGCTYAIDTGTAPTGTVHATGLCDDGSNAAGFALAITGAASVTQTCAGVATIVSVTLAGTADVVPAD